MSFKCFFDRWPTMIKLKICLFTILAIFWTSLVKSQKDSVNETSGNEKVLKKFS